MRTLRQPNVVPVIRPFLTTGMAGSRAALRSTGMIISSLGANPEMWGRPLFGHSKELAVVRR